MGSRIALVLRLLAALAVGTTVLVLAEPATALTVPQTLADRRPVQAGPVESAFPIDSVGVIWDADHADEHADDEAEGAHGAVRFRTDGVWGPWIDLVEDGAAAEGQWASALVDGGDADAYQVRGIPADARSPRAVAINTTDGPSLKVGERPARAAGALASNMCQSRADWGADESLRFENGDVNGTEIWPVQHHPVQVLSVHHTATQNGETGAEAEARLRSIYRYHAIDRGWGDIGYQYLIDAAGVVYEGRWSGEASVSCELAGGDGSDFGHESPAGDGDLEIDEMVTGAHIGGYNTGNMGVSLLGTFTRRGADPTAAAVGSLETVLAELSTRHELDPQGKVDYVNPINSYKKTVDTISAHRDWASTECPGDRLYVKLPDIRKAVAAAMGGTTTTDAPPTVGVTSPEAGATVKDTITITATASDDKGVSSVAFSAPGLSTVTDTEPADGWSASWNTTLTADGTATVAATATDTVGQKTTHSITVTVDNTADTTTGLTVTMMDPGVVTSVRQTNVKITGTGFAPGATLTFLNGKGGTPTATVTSVATDGTTLDATVSVPSKGPDGYWDVVVTQDGKSATCTKCAFVDR